MTSLVANSEQDAFFGEFFGALPSDVRKQMFGADAKVYKTMCQTNKAFKKELEANDQFDAVRETARVYQNITKACYVKQSCVSHGINGLYFKGSAVDSSVIYSVNFNLGQRNVSKLQVHDNGQIIRNLSEEIENKIKGELSAVENTFYIRSSNKNSYGEVEWTHATDAFNSEVETPLIHQFSTRGVTHDNKISYATAPEVRGFAALQGVDAVLANGEVYLFSADNDHATFKHYVSLSVQERTNYLAQQKKLQLSTIGIKAIGVSADGTKLYVRGVEEFAVYDFSSERAKTHKFASILTRMRTLTFYLKEMYKEMVSNVAESIKNILKLAGVTTGAGVVAITAIVIAILLVEPVVTLSLVATTALIVAGVAAASFVLNCAFTSFALGCIGLNDGRIFAARLLAP